MWSRSIPSDDTLWKFTFQDVPRPSGKRSSVSESVLVGTRCHSTWLKHSQWIHSRTDSTSSGQIWARESCSCWAHHHQVTSRPKYQVSTIPQRHGQTGWQTEWRTDGIAVAIPLEYRALHRASRRNNALAVMYVRCLIRTHGWLCGAVVRASDFWSGGLGFDSPSARYQAPRSAQPSIPSGSVNRVPAFTGWG